MSEISLTTDNLLSLTCHLNADDCEAYDSRYEISAALESLALVLFKADWDYPVTIVAIAG